MSPAMLPAALAILFGGAMVALVVVSARRAKGGRDRLMDRLDECGAEGEGSERVLRAGAHRVRTAYAQGSRNSPSSFRLIVEVQAPGSFILEEEGSKDRFFEGLGLEGKIATHDPEFDARLHIASDDEEFTGSYFASAQKRRAAQALFNLGCRRVELDDGGLKAVWIPFEAESADAGFVKEALPQLAALAEELPPGPPARAGTIDQRRFNAFYSLSFLGVMVGFFALPILARAAGLRPLDGTGVLLASLPWSAGAFAAYLLAAVALLKGKSWFGSGILKAGLLGLLLFPLAGYWTFLWVNCRCDASPAARHLVPVEGKWTSSGRHATYYHARVRSWREQRASESLSVSRDAYYRLQPGRTVALIDTKAGRLGQEWIVGLRFADGAPSP